MPPQTNVFAVIFLVAGSVNTCLIIIIRRRINIGFAFGVVVVFKVRKGEGGKKHSRFL